MQRKMKTAMDPVTEADELMMEIAKLEISLARKAAAIEERIAALKDGHVSGSADAIARLEDAQTGLNDRIGKIFGKEPPRSRTCPAGRYGIHRVARLKIVNPAKVISFARQTSLPLFTTVERVDKQAIRAAIKDGWRVPGAILSVQDTPWHKVDRGMTDDAAQSRTIAKAGNGHSRRAVA